MEALGTVAVALHEALGALLWLLWSLAHCSPPCSWLMRDQTPLLLQHPRCCCMPRTEVARRVCVLTEPGSPKLGVFGAKTRLPP